MIKLKKNILLVALGIALFSFLLASSINAADEDEEPVKYTPGSVDCSEEAQKARENYYIGQGFGYYDPCANTCATSSGNIIQLSGNDNLEKILKYLTTKGFSPEQSAGIAGNMLHESGFSPFRQEDAFKDEWPNGGYGIAKFTGTLRTGVTAALSEKLSDVFTEYYLPSNGGGTTTVTDYIPSGIPENINDQFLIVELDYLYEYMTGFALDKDEPYVKALADDYSLNVEDGVSLLDYIKTLSSASDVAKAWAYLYEQNSEAEDVVVVRSASAQSIIDNYPPQSADECSGGSKQQLAQEILDTGNIYYDYGLSEPEKNLLPDIASGKNNGNDWPCGMNIHILNGIAAIAKEHRIRLNSLNRACSNNIPDGSSRDSWHYAGNGSAVDFGPIDSLSSYSTAGANLIIQYMGQFMVDGSGIGQSYNKVDGVNVGPCLGNSLNLPPGIQVNYFGDFCTHLHVEVPPDSDPDLKCKTGNKGRCSEANRIAPDVAP